jgi:hypothetical protein
MMTRRLTLFPFTLAALGLVVSSTGCSTIFEAHEKHFADLSEERVVARIEGASSRPEWLEEETLDRDSGKWLILGFAIVPESAGADEAVSAAEKRARRELSSAITERLENVVSVLETQSADLTVQRTDSQRFRERLDQNLPAVVRLKHRYWEQVPQKFRGFARVEVAAHALRQLVLETAQSLEAQNAIRAPLAAAIRTHIDTVVDFDSHEVTPLFQMAPAGQN